MNLLPKLRSDLSNYLADRYFQTVSSARKIKQALLSLGISTFPLDHCAIIDLPSEHSGIPTLSAIFSALGYVVQGRDYLPEKQNDFLWLAEYESDQKRAEEALPQVVVADFRLVEMPAQVRAIIQTYTSQMAPSPLPQVQILAGKSYRGDAVAAKHLLHLLQHYFAGRDWPMPSIADFETVHAFNELLAWVLVWGRIPNHFTLPIHLLPMFSSLTHFNDFVSTSLSIDLNEKGGTIIKGNSSQGLEQSSTADIPISVALADGNISMAERFVEFIFRFPQNTSHQARDWKDYFTGFIANNANRVIESLYNQKNSANTALRSE